METIRFYRYMEAKYAFIALRDKKLRCSKLGELNDPYEMLSEKTESKLAQDFLQKYMNESEDIFLTISGSKIRDGTLLWSHYADKHQGICLGFDVDIGLVENITYKLEREENLDKYLINIKNGAKITENQEMFFLTKSIDWQYEKEIRITALHDNCEIIINNGKIERHFFAPFSSMVKLKEVIFGLRYPYTTKEKSAWQKLVSEDVKFYKAQLSKSKFNMDIIEI